MFLNDYIFEIMASIRKGVDDFNKQSPDAKAYYPPTVEFELNAQDFGEPKRITQV